MVPMTNRLRPPIFACASESGRLNCGEALETLKLFGEGHLHVEEREGLLPFCLMRVRGSPAAASPLCAWVVMSALDACDGT